MMALQIGCQVATSRHTVVPPYCRHIHLGAEKTPLVYQRLFSLPDCDAGGRP
jgi:hypothetical protein